MNQKLPFHSFVCYGVRDGKEIGNLCEAAQCEALERAEGEGRKLEGKSRFCGAAARGAGNAL